MKGCGVPCSGLTGLRFVLVIAQLCLALSLRAQVAPPPGDASPGGGNAAPPPAAPDSSATAPDSSATPPDTSASAPLYYNQTTPPSTFGEPGYGIIQRIPASELGTPAYGVPYSSVLYGNPFDPTSNHGFGTNVGVYPKVGQAEGAISFGFAGMGLSGLPFIHHAFAPTDADLKLGPLYLYFNSLQASMLYTDNTNLSATDRKSELFAIMSLNMTLLAQLTEQLQFSINGTLIYLPIQNIVGLETSRFQGSLGLVFTAMPTLTANVGYDTLIGGWPVRFEDVFRTSMGEYSDSTRDNFNLFDGSYLQQLSPGKYTFHSGQVDVQNTGFKNYTSDQENYFDFFSNNASATTYGYLPSDVEVTARADRTDLWYNNDTRGLPTSRDDFYILAQSIRPTMRFKPFASYEISYSSDVSGVYQIFRAGFSGPITDQLFLYTDVGYYLSNQGNQGVLWTLDLHHVAGEYTTEDLQVRRGMNDFDDEVITTEYYRLTQRLGPNLYGVLIADHSGFQELADNQTINRDQEDVGIGINWTLGPLTRLDVRGIYSRQNFDDGYDTDTWTARVNLTRTITDTLFFQAFYQYQWYHANLADRGYYENLVYLSLIKYFH